MSTAVAIQRDYYARTAAAYDEMHVSETDEQHVGLSWLSGLIKLHDFRSLLDVGSGTGRCLKFLGNEGLPIKMVGAEPVAELRTVAARNGLQLIDGDALRLPFSDGAFDVVCAFAILHHIEDHGRAVAEMCRVARRAVFISDANNFGQGGKLARAAKQTIQAFRLWRAFDLVRTKGKGYHSSDGDGVYYSYSLFNDVPILRQSFSDLQFMGSSASGPNLYRTAPHVAVFANRKTRAFH
jgi:ubiquinone/menaquinone biosynthesis C-methylase UbiE